MVEHKEPLLNSDAVVRAPRPIYVVACDISDADEVHSLPVLTNPGPGSARVSFDEELLPALPALWYAMHLPKTQFEVVDMPLGAMRDNSSEARRHEIMLIPTSLLQDSPSVALLCRQGQPVIILCPAHHVETARAVSEEVGFLLEPASFDSLNQDTLDAHWAALSARWEADLPPEVRLLPTAPMWSPTISKQGSHLAWKNFLRLLGHERAAPPELDDPFDMAFRQLYARARIEALTQLEDLGTEPTDAGAAMEELLPKVCAAIRIPLAIAVPGVSPVYERLVRGRSQAGTESSSSDDSEADQELVTDEDVANVLALVIGHQAAGDDSMGVVLTEPVPREAFHALADLERHWSTSAVPGKEEKLRQRLDEAMAHIWTDQFRTTLASASQIDAYTNFPIGLLRPPGHTAPLAAQIPITYRPLNPLTRTLQHQVSGDHLVDLSEGYSVLVAECIKPEDPVGEMSRIAWKHLEDTLGAPGQPMKVAVEETLTANAVREAIDTHRPEVLILSAHGSYLPASNLAGLVIGDEFSLGLDLGPMPPLVILSACTSGPRGGGAVAVADLLIRQGAGAVVSTLVPVRVDHNSVFMTRLLLYVNEAIGQTEDHTTLLDLWHRVQTNTVIMDVLYGNRRLMAWGHDRTNGITPVEAFMGAKSAGRIRTNHLYEDAEAVLLEIAEEQGMQDKVAGWLRSPGYLPEAMMYTLVGDASRIRFRPPKLRQREPQPS